MLMTKWYTPYLTVFDRPVQMAPADVMQRIKQQLQVFSSEDPLLSIVVIAHNEDRNLLGCLWSLSEQACGERMELLVVNNHSTDQTEMLLKRLGVVYYNEPRRGPGFARQCGLDHARGKYIICIDADTLYPPFYVRTHLEALQKAGVSCAFSLWSFLPKYGQSALSLLLYEFLRDVYLQLQYIKRPELCVRGMVFSFKADLARPVGFRTDIRRGEDGSLALALKPFGKIVFIRSRKARAVTGQNTLNADGSLMDSFGVRLRKAFASLGGLFVKKEHYEDEDSNIIGKDIQ